MQAEDDPLALDRHVSTQLHKSLPLVVATVQVEADVPEHPLDRVVRVDDRPLGPAAALGPTSSSSSPGLVTAHHCTDQSEMEWIVRRRDTLEKKVFDLYLLLNLQCSYRCVVVGDHIVVVWS